jgi:glycosyltransferase involved in cell wall biosynthesis
MKRAPWVLEIRDLWPESILAVGAITNKKVIRALEYLEMFAYRKADRIVPVTDSFEQYMINKGIDGKKIEVIKNGVDLSFYEVRQKDSATQRELGIEGKFIASYFGTHGMAHHLETILDAAELLRGREDIVFLMVGDGAERERILRLREEQKLDNVIMLSQQPKERMPELWAISDVSLVLLKKMDLFQTVIPSKIFESMAMKKPIILGVEGESRKLVESARGGLAIEPENSKELAQCLVKLADNPELRAALGNQGREFVSAHFDRKVLARRYLATISTLVARAGDAGNEASQKG